MVMEANLRTEPATSNALISGQPWAGSKGVRGRKNQGVA